MLEEMAMNMVLAILKAIVKNPKKKAAFRVRMLKIRDAINAMYSEE